MSQPETHAHPVRRRAGLLSALSRLYATVRRFIDSGGSTEDALELQQKLHERYATYMECHEIALFEVPERENSLNASQIDVDGRHQEAVAQLQAYIDDVVKSERSLHVRSLFSANILKAGSSKTVSKQQSSQRSVVSQAKSDRLSETRIQAELAKKNMEQQRLLQEAQQRKLAEEREAARQQLEFERQAAQRDRKSVV